MAKTRRSKSKRRGGAVLGVGSQGVVFDPPLLCEDGTGAPGDSYVSKAIYLSNPTIPDKEMRFASLIRQKLGNDFANVHTILPEKQCAMSKHAYESYDREYASLQNNNMKKHLMQDKERPNTLLFLKKATGSLGELYIAIETITDSKTLSAFLKSMNMDSLDEFKGKLSDAFDRMRVAVEKMHKVGLFHNDISRNDNQIFENVMYVLESNDIHLKLIDFGIAKLKIRVLKNKPNNMNLRKNTIDVESGVEELKKTEMEDITTIKKEFMDLLEEHTKNIKHVNAQTSVKCKLGSCTIMGGKRRTRICRR